MSCRMYMSVYIDRNAHELKFGHCNGPLVCAQKCVLKMSCIAVLVNLSTNLSSSEIILCDFFDSLITIKSIPGCLIYTSSYYGMIDARSNDILSGGCHMVNMSISYGHEV